MNRNIILGIIIAILILILGFYHVMDSQTSLDWNTDDQLYPLNVDQQKWLAQKETLVIGVPDDTAPLLVFEGSGASQGLLKDYIDLIGNGYHIPIEYIPVLSADIGKLLKEGRIDAAICMQDMELDKSVEFTMPVVKTKGILFVKNDVPGDIEQGDDLQILLLGNNPSYQTLKREFPDAEFTYSENMKEMTEKMQQGEGNALAGSEASLIYFFGKEELDKNWKRASGYLYEKNDCLAVNEENTVLYEILNNAVYHMDNEKVIAELQAKWTGISYPLYVENKLEGLGILILIIVTAVLCVFFLFYQSNKSLYEELQQRMELLIESQNEMQTTFDGVTYYLAELNRYGVVININKAFSQYLSMKRHKAMGLPFVSLLKVDEAGRQKLSEIILETFRDECEQNDEIMIGKKIFEVHTFLIKNNKEQIQKILTMMVDVTEVRNTERQMLQNHKMIAIGQLAAGVAHEIRNPLGLIRNYCYVLKEIDYRDYITRDEAIAVIEKSVNKSGRIIDNLLNFSRLSTNKREIINLKVQIGTILDLQRSLLVQREIDLYYEYAGSCTVEINIEEIEMVLINLITNAVDAIGNHGEIKVFCMVDGQYVNLTIHDDGKGIPAEVMDEIYNPFFTTKKKSEGSGLGLYIVYNEVEKMGGNIKAESEIGKGTTFYIKIPTEKGEKLS